MADAKRKALKLNRVLGSGAKTPDTVVLVVKDYEGQDITNDDGTPAVTITLRPIAEDERRKIVAEFTRLEKDPNGGRGLFEHTDAQGANDEILRQAIVRWDGIVGYDEQPLVCTDATKLALDAFVRSQITRKLFGSEVVEVLAASFR